MKSESLDNPAFVIEAQSSDVFAADRFGEKRLKNVQLGQQNPVEANPVKQLVADQKKDIAREYEFKTDAVLNGVPTDPDENSD